MIDLADPSKIATATLDGPEGWQDYPVDAVRVLEGSPTARFKPLRIAGIATPQHRASLLEVTPGRFAWRFAHDESWIVLEGRCQITLDTGEELDCVPGQLASVPAGHDSEWDVTERFMKFVVTSSGRAGEPHGGS